MDILPWRNAVDDSYSSGIGPELAAGEIKNNAIRRAAHFQKAMGDFIHIYERTSDKEDLMVFSKSFGSLSISKKLRGDCDQNSAMTAGKFFAVLITDPVFTPPNITFIVCWFEFLIVLKAKWEVEYCEMNVSSKYSQSKQIR